MLKHMKPASMGDQLRIPQPRCQWVAQEKKDGHRIWLYFDYDGNRLYSSSGKRITEVEPYFQFPKEPAIVDGELAVLDKTVCQCESSGRAEGFDAVTHYRAAHPEALGIEVFDIVKQGDEDLSDLLYWERLSRLRGWMVGVQYSKKLALIDMVKCSDTHFQEWLSILQESGTEGIVIKHLESRYHFGSRRRVWQKWKWGRTREADVVIKEVLPPTEKMASYMCRLGYGYANTDVVGVFPRHVHKDEAHKYIGWVAELHGHDVMPSGAVLYPRFARWREDKLASECIRR